MTAPAMPAVRPWFVLHDGKRRRVVDVLEVGADNVYRLEVRAPGRAPSYYSAPADECQPASCSTHTRTLRAGDVSLSFNVATGVVTLRAKGRRPRAGYTATLDALYWMTAKAEAKRQADARAIARRDRKLKKR